MKYKVVLFAAMLSCGETTSDELTETTELVVLGSTVTRGKGCGAGHDQVFRYVAVADGPLGAQSGLYDCFADAHFMGLVLEQDLPAPVQVTVLAFRQSDYLRANENGALEADARTPERARTYAATWTFDCTATQRYRARTFATCAPPRVAASGS